MIIGVDVGTSISKAAAIGRDGRARHTASRPSTLINHPGGQVEQDLDEVLATVGDVVRKVAGAVDEPVEAVAITGQGDGLWLRDEDGNAARPPISWLDARASPIIEQWRRGGNDSIVQKMFARTGAGVFPGCHAPLIAHLAEHEPQSLDRAAVAGYCVDAILQRLTGVITVDASDASLPFLDVVSRQYDESVIELCGIEQWRHLLPDPATPLTVHHLDRHGAEILGLPEGTPLTAGPYDLLACGYGSGVTAVGDGTLIVGTTLSCQVVTDRVDIDPTAEPAGMWLCTPDPASWLRVMPSMVGTAGLEWALGLVGRRAEHLDEVVAASEPGARGVRALSFLSASGERAPFLDPSARGQLVGLTTSSTPADVVQAMLEAIMYAARSCFEVLDLQDNLTAAGGGLQSAALGQTLADIMGRPIQVPTEQLIGARGAASVAWQALGHSVDLESWRSQSRRIDPDPTAVEAHQRGYEQYMQDLATARAAWARS